VGAASLAAAALMAACAVVAANLLLGRRSLGRIAHGLWDEMSFIVLAAAALIAVRAAMSVIEAIVRPVAVIPSSTHALQPLVLWLQESTPPLIGVIVLGAAYVLIYIFTLALVVFFLLAEDRGRFRRYVKALILAYVISLTLHVLIGSTRPGLDPASGIAPLLYGDTLWGPLSADLMGRGNSFPSTHVTMVTVTWLATLGQGRINLLPLALLVIMPVAVLYLGVHWPVDVIAGMITGAVSYLAIALMENYGERGFIRSRPG
jgi:membrane-associated phospholipid phosphatase